MASKVCFRFKACSFNSKMSPEVLKSMYSISDVIKVLPRTQKRLITTQSRTNSVSVTSNKNQINSTCILTSRASPILNQKSIRSNILQDGSNRFLKTLSSLLSQDSVDGTKQQNEQQSDVKEETCEEHEHTIYKGILSAQIKLVKSFSLMTSVIGLSCQPFLLYQIQNSGTGSLGVAAAGGAFFSFFTFATPLLIHWVSKKYVTELLYNKIEDSYTAITYSLLLKKKKVNFKISDVTVPDMPPMFTTIMVGREKQIPLFVEGVHAFSDPQHYVKLMGYDKPLNLRWDKEANASQSVVESRRKKLARKNRNSNIHK